MQNIIFIEKMITFSVIIPTYNRANVIGRAIKSVLAQSFDNLELLIVDDGSTDNTVNAIAGFADKRIRYIKHEHNKGQNFARNTGVMAATGQYVAFLDSDDEWAGDMLQKVYNKFKSDPELGCVYSRIFGTTSFDLEGYIYREALAQGYISSMITLSVKKECLEKVGLFDVAFTVCDDDEICFRLAKEYKFGLIRECLALTHSDGGAQVTSDRLDNARGWLRLFNKYQEDILKYCGKEVLVRHYCNCARQFLDAGDRSTAQKLLDDAMRLKKNTDVLKTLILLYIPGWVYGGKRCC